MMADEATAWQQAQAEMATAALDAAATDATDATESGVESGADALAEGVEGVEDAEIVARLAAEVAEANAKLAQFNAHDVKRLRKQASELMLALAQHGRGVQQDQLRVMCEAGAVAQLLVAKGIVSEHELQGRIYLLANAALAEMLQRLEVQRLTANRPQIVTPQQGGGQGGGIIVPGR